jgi:hypothetical protein
LVGVSNQALVVESVWQLDGEITVKTRYFISSLEKNAEKFALSGV